MGFNSCDTCFFMPMGFTIILLRIKTYKAALSSWSCFFCVMTGSSETRQFISSGALCSKIAVNYTPRWSILDILLVEEIPNNHLVNNGINYRPQLVQDFWTINSHTQQKGHFYLHFTDSPTYILQYFPPKCFTTCHLKFLPSTVFLPTFHHDRR